MSKPISHKIIDSYTEFKAEAVTSVNTEFGRYDSRMVTMLCDAYLAGLERGVAILGETATEVGPVKVPR